MAGRETVHGFVRSPVAVLSAIVTIGFVLASSLAPWIAPQNPFDVATLELSDAFLPPAWQSEGSSRYLLGTDGQGRDILSAILFGCRISLLVGFSAVMFSLLLGVSLGTVAGYTGGWLDALIMRLADVQLTIPAILVALLINGTALVLVSSRTGSFSTVTVLILSIGIAGWPGFARVARSCVMVECSKAYVEAARMIGIHSVSIMLRHILPNIVGSVLVIATIELALAIIAEATLSYLGVGMPATTPSLGTLIRIGNDFLFSGEWWIILFPSFALVVLVLAVNLLGDWLRDALDPMLR